MFLVNNIDVSKVVYRETWTEALDNSCSTLSFSLPTAQAGLNFRTQITRAEHSFSGNEHTAKLTLERSAW